MLSKEMTYTDYDGNERTETFYFNLNEAELMEMSMSESGGLPRMINRIVAEQDSKRIIEMFKTIILKSYGKKSPDGKRFVKTKELQAEFEQTPAFSNLFMELATDADKAGEFIDAIVPKVKGSGESAGPELVKNA